MSRDDAALLGESYDRLRIIEHRLQMIEDRQTHCLPREAQAIDNVARLDGLADGAALVGELKTITAQVTMRFHSKLIAASRDKDGNVIDGRAERVTDITDVWTFARDVSSRDPNWKLVATEAGH